MDEYNIPDKQADEVAAAVEQLRKSVTWAEVYSRAEVNVSALAIQKTLLGYDRLFAELTAARKEIVEQKALIAEYDQLLVEAIEAVGMAAWAKRAKAKIERAKKGGGDG